ncbi:zinc finger protein [Elysia marginata]|uniref:Zinc finger protein n=1 Tax=Elysia marginata TaxID=1093978 RepID=A0AAV4F587_9GAST|nr:zinc finger protein [Elysia marginata]
MDAAHDIAQHRQDKDFTQTQSNSDVLMNTEDDPKFQDGPGDIKRSGLDAREVAIQANDYEIERKFSHLPARKRYIPLKFSDYRVSYGASQSENKKEEEEEEAEEDITDSTFKPSKDLEKHTHKTPRKRGRPRKNVDAIISEDGATSNNQKTDGDGKATIIKVASGFKCSLCGHVFTLRGNAKSHLITHTDKKPFSCDFEGCGKSVRTKEALRRHQLSHLGIKMFECTICKKKLSTNLSLKEHMAVHTGDKPLICPICGKKFRQKTVMKRHIVTHTAEKPYACSVCGKRFSMKIYVKSHMKTHTGERPFTCETCGKTFAHASDLKRHKIIHTGEKPYACSICPMRYSDVSSRKRHEREHQTGQQFLCTMCNQRFSRAGHLRSHLVRAHKMGSNDLYGAHTMDKSRAQSDMKISLDEKSPDTAYVKERSQDNVAISVLDPSLNRIDTLQPNFTYKVIENPNNSNILEFHLEESDGIQSSNIAGLNLDGIAGEASLTVIKDKSTDTLMVIQQTPGQFDGNSQLQEQHQQVEMDSASCSNQWQVCVGVDPSSRQTDASEMHINVQQAADSNIDLANSTLSARDEIDLARKSNLDSQSNVLNIPIKEEVSDTKPVGDSLMVTEAISDEALKYIYQPDLTSQDYYNWLSVFTEYCKALSLPLQKDMFHRLSHVQKTLTDFMASPTGVITDKNNFKELMNITKDLSDIISGHLMLMYQNLP